jgi:hypothetical protein
MIYAFHLLSDLKEMKKDLGNYTYNPDQYIQALITIIQTYDLAWKDVMLLLDQTLTSLEKQQVLAKATQMEDDFHRQCVPMSLVPGNERIEIAWIPTGAQAVPQADPHWDSNNPGNKWRRHHFT